MLRIVIPTYNRSYRVIKLLEHLLSFSGDFEIIVVDDNSKNEEKKELKKYQQSNSMNNKLKIIYNDYNTGGAGARNVGANYSGTFSYIWFLDDDDFIKTDNLKLFLNFLSSTSDKFIVFSALYGSNEIIPITDDLYQTFRRYGQNFNTSCCVLSRDLYFDIGGWDSELVAGQDTDLLLRISKKTDAFHYRGIKINVIEHSDERITSNWKKQMKGKYQFIKKHHRDLYPTRLLRYILTYIFHVPYFKYLLASCKNDK